MKTFNLTVTGVFVLTIGLLPAPARAVWYQDNSQLSWSPGAVQGGWDGWWFRHNTEWFQFEFSGVTPPTGWLRVEFYLPVTNRMTGVRGLDGLVDVVINPGRPAHETTTITNVLLDNLDPSNRVYAHGDSAGFWRTKGTIDHLSTAYVIGGQLVVRVLRHTDSSLAPTPLVGTYVPIDMTTSPPNVPAGVYESDDAKTVHIFVYAAGHLGHDVNASRGEGWVRLTEGSPPGPTAVPAVGGWGLAALGLVLVVGLANRFRQRVVAT